MANRRVGGIIFLKINGELFSAKGTFTYDIGVPERTAVVGADAVHGFMEKPKAPMIEGAITDSSDLQIKNLFELRDATVTLELANGKVIVLREAFFSGESAISTEEGEVPVKFEGLSAQEVRA